MGASFPLLNLEIYPCIVSPLPPTPKTLGLLAFSFPSPLTDSIGPMADEARRVFFPQAAVSPIQIVFYCYPNPLPSFVLLFFIRLCPFRYIFVFAAVGIGVYPLSVQTGVLTISLEVF